MKKTFLIAAMVAAFVFSALAQTGKYADEEFCVGLTYSRSNIDVAVPVQGQFAFDAVRDSYGPKLCYFHNFGRKNGRGDLGIGIEGGVTFNKLNGADAIGNSVVKAARAQYALRYQLNNPKYKFHPFVKGTVGASREQFKYRFLTDPDTGEILGLSRGANTFTYGGGAGFDYGRGRTRLRFEVEYYAAKARDSDLQHNAEASIGIVF